MNDPMSPWRICIVALICAGFVLALLMLTGPTAAQTRLCAPTPVLLANLMQRHGEVVIWTGETTGDSQLIITASGERSWTAIVTVDGMGCIVSAGSRSIRDSET